MNFEWTEQQFYRLRPHPRLIIEYKDTLTIITIVSENSILNNAYIWYLCSRVVCIILLNLQGPY